VPAHTRICLRQPASWDSRWVDLWTDHVTIRPRRTRATERSTVRQPRGTGAGDLGHRGEADDLLFRMIVNDTVSPHFLQGTFTTVITGLGHTSGLAASRHLRCRSHERADDLGYGLGLRRSLGGVHGGVGVGVL
jgi:hypothetical protein